MNPSIKKFIYLFVIIGLVNSTSCAAWGGRWGFGGGWGWDGGWRRPWGGPAIVYDPVVPVYDPYYHHDGAATVAAGIGGLAIGAALASSNTPRTAAQEEDLARAQEIRRESAQRAEEARAERQRRNDEERAERQKRRDEERAERQRRKDEEKAERQRRVDEEKAEKQRQKNKPTETEMHNKLKGHDAEKSTTSEAAAAA